MAPWLQLITVALAAAVQTPGDPGLSPKELKAARKIYVVKCAKCHRFYEPKDYAPRDWQQWLEAMNLKSGLKPAQAELLTRYLAAYRTGRVPGKPQDKR